MSAMFPTTKSAAESTAFAWENLRRQTRWSPLPGAVAKAVWGRQGWQLRESDKRRSRTSRCLCVANGTGFASLRRFRAVA